VRQVGYLLELYRDARSPEYKEVRIVTITATTKILCILQTEVGRCMSQYAVLHQLHRICSCRSGTDWTCRKVGFCHGKA